MSQFARPDSDISNDGGWNTSPLWDDIDDSVDSPDANLVTVSISYLASAKMFEVGLSDVIDPTSSSDHVVRVRGYFSRLVGAAAQFITVDLVEGTTVRATASIQLTLSETTHEFTLTGGEADAITSYSNLRLRVSAEPPDGLNTENGLFINAAELRIPDAGFLHLDVDLTNGGLKEVAAASGNYLIIDGGGYQRVAGIEVAGGGALKLNASKEIVTG